MPDEESIGVSLVNLGFLGEPARPDSEEQVSRWVVEMLKQIRRPPPLAPGFTEQATIDGALLAAAKLAGEHVRRRLPHKSTEQASQDTVELFKRLNNLVADYIEAQTKFRGN